MPRNAPSEPEAEPFAEVSLSTLIGRQVIRSLGSPKDLLKVKVHPVGSDRYRVNIVTGKDFATSRIANSFFLTADDKGKILASVPEIVKMY